MKKIRVIEIGATHIRRADIRENKITNLEIHRTAETLSGGVLSKLNNFARENWDENIQALAILVAGPIQNNIVELMPNFAAFPKNTDFSKSLDMDVPVLVWNDMTAAVTGMAELLKKEDINSPFWGLTWSSGLGGKFWDGKKIAIESEVGHEIFICNEEAEDLLGGLAMAEEIGKPLEEVTAAFSRGENWAKEFYFKKARLMGLFLQKLNSLAPTELFVFKGSIAKNILINEEIMAQINQELNEKIKIILSPEPDKDSLFGAEILTRKALLTHPK